ncbi:MAG: gliding motility-associated C-terminal domain-containing protein [Flavipsychrobacter sp.]|nr:gliding motility-associated C-terminal domain-containing protein [Flavipsychrobacter sp.]
MPYRGILIVYILLCCNFQTYASHSAGGELSYEWISDSTYRVVLKFYRDCSGIPINQTVPLCITNTCGKPNVVGMLQLINALPDGSPNGSVVSSGCPGYGNTCTNSASRIPGYQEWWYDDTVTLSGICTKWSFSVNITARNSSVNLSTSGNLFLEATLNNSAFANNNSPVFSIKPIPYCILNKQYYYNNGVIDIDGDSMTFENIIPQNGGSVCNGLPSSFAFATPLLNIKSNPFQTNNTYKLDTTTGSIGFIPGLSGAQTTTLLVKEYRNGMQVGSVLRDIQIQVINTGSPDSISYDVNSPSLSNCVYRGGVVYTCINKNVSFCFNVQSSNTSGHLVIADNHKTLFSGGVVSYTNQTTHNVTGCYTFTSPAIAQKKNFLIIVKDSTCKPPGIIFYQVFTIPIIISDDTPKLTVVKNYTYCKNDVATPLSGVGTGLLWYSLGSNVGSHVAPTPATDVEGSFKYYAEANNGCYSIWDTITVDVLPKAEASILVSTDTVCLNELMTVENVLYNQGINYSWTTDNATITSNNANKILTLKWNTKGLKKLHLNAYNSKCNQSDSVFVFVSDEINSGLISMQDSACVGEKVDALLSVKNNRKYLFQTEDTSIIDNANKTIYLFWKTAGNKTAVLTTHVEGCINKPYSKSIFVHPLPDAAINIIGTKVCTGEQVSLQTAESNGSTYFWYPKELFYNNEGSIVNTLTGLNNNTIVSVIVNSKQNCKNTDTVELKPEVCCRFMLPDAFSPNGDGKNDMFGVLTFMSVTEYKMIITNRWGQVVFRSNDVKEKWNGMFNNVPSDIGTYGYYLVYKCMGESVNNRVRGTLQLIR